MLGSDTGSTPNYEWTPSEEQRGVLTDVYEYYREAHAWPLLSNLVYRLQLKGHDPEEVIGSIPEWVAGTSRVFGWSWANPQGNMTVTLEGVNFTESGPRDLQAFVQVLEGIQRLAQLRGVPSLGSEPAFQVTSGAQVDSDSLAIAGLILLDFSGVTRAGGRNEADSTWMAVIDLIRLERYADVESVDQLLTRKRTEREEREQFLSNMQRPVVRVPRGMSGFKGVTRTEGAVAATIEDLVSVVQPNVDPNLVYAIMPFTEDWSMKVYGWMTESVSGLRARFPELRIEKSGTRRTDVPWILAIQSSIRRARLVLCDLTSNAEGVTNGNCLYELGLAQGYDKKKIVISQSEPTEAPSDVQAAELIQRYDLGNHDGFVSSMQAWILEAMGDDSG
jgi:hypothetical protein